MVLAYARTHANDGAQVKRMLDGRRFRGAKKDNNHETYL